ncbi:MAG: hypothetical protein CM1200mP30_32280 [Pseudomonadota bacterium]|nr:MAG: hypothetical protein CM1200mP30_32280 [Pseudomonadota bacterium]
MVYLLQAYFGRDGREEAESLWKGIPEIRTNRVFWVPLMNKLRMAFIFYVHIFY